MAIADWLNCRKPSNEAESSGSRLSAKCKEERGISNDITGQLLCPIEYDWEDPEYVNDLYSLFDLILPCRVRAKLREADPEYDFTSSFFLRCLYDGENGDHRDPEKGFLKGPLLLRVSQLHSRHSVYYN